LAEARANPEATIRDMATALRVLAMDGVQAANSGHPGMPMGMADVAAVLFGEFLKFDARRPDWADRDRFILSAGHGSMLLYGLLHLMSYARPTRADLASFRQLHSPCAGHPENFELAGVEATTGPLGQGLAMAVGFALAERHLNARFGDDLVDHRTWVIAGDGCLMEGINHEAIGLAGHLGLGRLTVLWDDNRITIDGAVSLSSSEDVAARFAAAGWHVIACDGHDIDSIRDAVSRTQFDERPSLVRCRTRIGHGAPNKADSHTVHGSPLGIEEVAATRLHLNWPHAPFELPGAVADFGRSLGQRGVLAREAWQTRLAAHPERIEFERLMSGDLPATFDLSPHIAALIASPKPMATRKASELALEAINGALGETVGGSADLTPSNNTKTSQMTPLTRDDYGGRYVRYGIREFGMAAAMNGMALHGGVIPYGGTFLVFSDYCRAAIRLAALQRIRVIFVMTHDSIGLGEDGPTHQPIEHVMSLRMIPGLDVFRPADAVETAECWELALRNADRPSVIALSRQDVPLLRTSAGDMLSAKGAYRLRTATAQRRAVLVATGTEVATALTVADLLAEQGIGVDVVSMPSWRHFDEQPEAYRRDLLPHDVLTVSIEAGVTLGWQRYIGRAGLALGIDSFGVSAPGEVAFRHFGLDADTIASRVAAVIAISADAA
jgi:transketolase